jgi:hypothetical protein
MTPKIGILLTMGALFSLVVVLGSLCQGPSDVICPSGFRAENVYTQTSTRSGKVGIYRHRLGAFFSPETEIQNGSGCVITDAKK